MGALRSCSQRPQIIPITFGHFTVHEIQEVHADARSHCGQGVGEGIYQTTVNPCSEVCGQRSCNGEV